MAKQKVVILYITDEGQNIDDVYGVYSSFDKAAEAEKRFNREMKALHEEPSDAWDYVSELAEKYPNAYSYEMYQTYFYTEEVEVDVELP